MLLKPADVDASFRGVVNAVKSGRITEQRVEESARKIMAAKYDLGLVEQRQTPVDTIDRIVANRPCTNSRARLLNVPSRLFATKKRSCR